MYKLLFDIRQWATHLVYVNRFAAGLYKTVSMINATRRVWGLNMAKSFCKHSDSATENEPLKSTYAHYQQTFSEVPGWFLPEAQAAWDCLLAFQTDQKIQGPLLEIGVWRGKSAALSTLHAEPNETCVYVDRLMLAEFKELIGRIRTSGTLFLEILSECLLSQPQVTKLGATFRWIHIDGEHSGEAVRNDLRVAESLLADDGMICVDDFPSSAYPQVNFAVVEFLSQHPQITMVACGHNKGYICRRESAPRYLQFIKNELHRDMVQRGSEVTIWKSGRPDDANCFGITDRVEQFDYRGPDWNPGTIEI